MESQKGKHKMLMRIYPVRHRLNLIEITDCEARRVQNSVELLYEKQMWLWFYTLHAIWTTCTRFVHSLTKNWREAIVWAGSSTQGRGGYVVKHAFPEAAAVLKHTASICPHSCCPRKLTHLLTGQQICPALVHLFQEESEAGPGDAVLQRSAQVPAACPPMAQNCNETAQVWKGISTALIKPTSPWQQTVCHWVSWDFIGHKKYLLFLFPFQL